MTATAPPRQAIARELIWPSLKYEPHEGQVKIHASTARHRLASCGRRFGKSTAGGHELIPEALVTFNNAQMLHEAGKRREFWAVGPEYSDSEKEFRVFYNAAKRLELPFDRPGTYNNPDSGDMVVSLWDGAFLFEAKSGKHPERLVGEGLAGVLMCEAAKMKQSIWTKYVRPTLADLRGWSLFLSTPEGKNWFYQLWRRGQDPNDPNWASWKMPSWVNNLVFPDGRLDSEIADMAADMSSERFEQEIGASFTEFVGRVFKDFDEELHVTDCELDVRYPVYAACDYGWTNPFVWLIIQVDVWDNVYVLAEYRAQQKDINDIAGDLKGYPINRKLKMFYPDPAEPGDTAVLSKALHVPASTSTGGELKWRLEMIRQKLKVGPDTVVEEARMPSLFIDRSCTELIREMGDYRYPETKPEQLRSNTEQPLDKDDHGPEALGRFFRGYYGPPPAPGGNRARVSKANLG